MMAELFSDRGSLQMIRVETFGRVHVRGHHAGGCGKRQPKGPPLSQSFSANFCSVRLEVKV